jgi:hypothetical protein
MGENQLGYSVRKLTVWPGVGSHDRPRHSAGAGAVRTGQRIRRCLRVVRDVPGGRVCSPLVDDTDGVSFFLRPGHCPLCVRMARINVMLYGLDGRYAPAMVMESAARLQKAGKVADKPELHDSNGAAPILGRISITGSRMRLPV